jgi:hypothetical protein
VPAVQAPLGALIPIASIPAGTHVAIAARIAHYARGCFDVDALSPTVTREIPLAIYDVPIALGQADLESTYTFDVPTASDLSAWNSVLDEAIARAATAFVPTSSTDAQALLGAMRVAVPMLSQGEFDASWTSLSWTASATTWLSSHLGSTSLRDRATAYMNQAKAGTRGPLVAHITGVEAGHATIALETFGDLSAQAAGLSIGQTFDWTADADDTVHLSGSMSLLPTALIASEANSVAAKNAPPAAGVASALEAVIDCAGFANALVGSGNSYGTCNASCTATLCRNALAAMWDAAIGASGAANGADSVLISLNASAQAEVGENAEPVHFAGTWVGKVTATSGASAVSGTALAQHGSIPH